MERERLETSKNNHWFIFLNSSLFVILLSGLAKGQIYQIPNQQMTVKINFSFTFYDMYGEQTPDLYSGGWFDYNITVTNNNNCNLNATYSVIVYSPDGTINGNTRTFNLDLNESQSGSLYPTNNLFSKNSSMYSPTNIDAHFADTTGTYKVNVTSNIYGLIFCRYANDNSSYNYMPNSYQMSLYATPSYQEPINNEQNQFYGNFSEYSQQFQQYSKEASTEASKAQNLTYATIGISIVATLISYIAIAKDQRFTRKIALLYTTLGGLISIVVLIIIPENIWLSWLTFVIFCLFGSFIFYKLRGFNKKEGREAKAIGCYTS